MMTFDITDRVLSETEYNTLKRLANPGDFTKEDCVFYSENSNVIKGVRV